MRLVFAMLAVLAMAGPARASHRQNASSDDDDDAPAEPGRPPEKGTLGVGVMVGEPLGICAKIYLAKDRALQIEVGSAFIANGFQISTDYLFHPWILQDRDSFVLPVYIGPGIRFIDYLGGLNDDSHAAIGVRGVIGMLFDFKKVPLDVFMELAAVIEYDFSSDAGGGFGLNLAAGIRYYF